MITNPLKKLSGALFGQQRFSTDTSKGGQYSHLRRQAFTITREQAALPTPPLDNPVWAVLMETGNPRVTETLVLVSDGTSSVYVSNGEGVIGGHGYENVLKANSDFYKLVRRDWRHLQPAEAAPIPEPGYTLFYARTDAGLLVGGGPEESFISGQHALSELFQAGHEAITQLHIIVVEKDVASPKGYTSTDFNKSGLAYAAKGDFYRAIVAYNKATERNTNYFEAYLNRGVAYGSLGNFDHALAEFNQAIALDPGNVFSYMNRANVYKFKRESDKVVADYGKAIELNPELADAYRERGLFYKSLEQRSDAIKDFERLLAISKDPRERKLVQEELKKLR